MFYCKFCKISKNTFFTENLWTTAPEFITEMPIFTSSRSQMFFKISVLKNFAILEPLSNNKVTDLLLQNTYGACFWIFVAANTFFLLNMVFIADSRTGFCSGLLWKHELNLRSSHWSCSVKRVFLEHFQNLLRSFTKFLRTSNLKSANGCFWNLFFHLDCPF